MTTSRIVRGTKARIFLYICAVLIITGIIACYNNTLSQLEDARKSNEICHQQEENLSTQLQFISDYKQKLEKTLKTERAEHQQVKNDLENSLNEEKAKNEKSANEANLRFNSLQQHFNILQTQYEDLQSKLKEFQDVKAEKENLNTQFLDLQSKNERLQSENEDLQKQIKQNVKVNQSQIDKLSQENKELRKELQALKHKAAPYESLPPPQLVPEASSANKTRKLRVDSNEYKIKFDKVADPSPYLIKTPSKSTTASNSKVSQGSLNGARPLLIPTVTPKGPKKLVPPLPYSKKIPEGVVPLPDKKTEEEQNELPGERINNRYRNQIDDIALKEGKKVDEVDKDNGAQEEFDQHNVYDHFMLDTNDAVKNAEKNNFNKHHIDHLAIGNENDDNPQVEENDLDDDPDYADNNIGQMKEPAVRH